MTFAWGRATIYEHLSWGFGLPILCLRRVPFLCPDPLGRTDLIGLGQSLIHPTSTTFDGVCFKSGPYSITYPLPPYPLPSSIGREPDDRSKLGCGACGGAFSRRRERRTPLGPAPKMVSDAVGPLPTASLMRNYLRNTARGAHKRAQKTPKAAQKPRPLSEAVLSDAVGAPGWCENSLGGSSFS
jgi:hypothetical protein